MNSREEYAKIKPEEGGYKKDDCPFCPANFRDNVVLWEGKFWKIIENKYPYSGNNQHIMAIPHRHVKYSADLTSEEYAEMKLVHEFVKQFFGENNYFSCTRESIGNRSVEHLHMHFIPGILKGKFLRKMLEVQGFPIIQDLQIS